jgi:hypothetical protein
VSRTATAIEWNNDQPVDRYRHRYQHTKRGNEHSSPQHVAANEVVTILQRQVTTSRSGSNSVVPP